MEVLRNIAGFHLRPTQPHDRDWIRRLMIEHWGAELVVAHGTLYEPHKLPGFVATNAAQEQPIGLITYQLQDNQCEIVTLDSLQPRQGIGSMLIEAVKDVARQSDCERIWLITTNDNLKALRFYQKRGFTLAALHRNTIELARRLKPQIPVIGEDGIPIRDEFELEYELRSTGSSE